MTADLPKLLTEDEVAVLLKHSSRWVRLLREKGLLPFIPGRPVMIDEADVVAYVEKAKVRRRSDATPKTEIDRENAADRGAEAARVAWQKMQARKKRR